MSVPITQRIVRDKIVTDVYRREGALATAGATFASGWSMMRAAAGTLQVATEVPGLLSGGFTNRDLLTADPTNNDFVNADTGIYAVDQSALAGDFFTSTSGPAPIYAIDNQLFGALPVNPSTGAVRSIAGLFLRLDRALFSANSSGKAVAWIGPEGAAMAASLLAAQAVTTRDRCRGVFTNLGGATVSYAGGIMTLAVGAMAAQDGIAQTPVAGEIYWAQKGLTNLPANGAAGPWQCITPGSASASPVFCRPWWWQTGTPINGAGGTAAEAPSNEIVVGSDGTGPLAPSRWKAFCAPGILVDGVGTDPLFWPQFARVGATLGAGGITPAVTNVPVRAWPGSRISFTPSTLASDGTVTLWRPTSVTPGAIGTATFTVTGESVAGTAVAGARTVGEVEVQNY